MDLIVYRDLEGFATLRKEWNPLLARTRFNSVFLTWEWQSTWWQNLGRGDLWLVAFRQDGELVGIAPLYLAADEAGHQHFHLVGCVEVSDYLDVIAAVGCESVVLESLLQWLAGPQAPEWDILDLCNLPEASQTHRLLPALAASRGLTATTEQEDVCPIIRLPDTWERYLQDKLDKKQRHEVRRKMRKIEREAEVRWYVVQKVDLDNAIDAFIQLHRLSTANKEEFMTAEMQQFFHEMSHVMHQAGWLHLAFIEVNGDKAATMLSFDYDDRILVYNSGYDPESYADLSPGIVLTSYVIQDAIERGRSIFDFLQGDEVYKYRFGATDTAVYRSVVWNQSAS